MLAEAVEIMRELWSGGFHSHHGKHFTVEDARIYTLPDAPPPIHVAASGPESVALAAEAGDGMVATQPLSKLTQAFDRATGGGKPKYGQLAVAVDDDEARARRLAHERFRFSAPGWKVMSELPNPVNFEAATENVREEDFDFTLAVNLKGTFFTSQAAGRVMIGQNYGRIINLGSQAGSVALPTESVYCMTKAGIAHIPRMGFHGSRRKFVNEMETGGVPVRDVTDMGGWASDNVVRTVYQIAQLSAHRAAFAARLRVRAAKQVPPTDTRTDTGGLALLNGS